MELIIDGVWENKYGSRVEIRQAGGRLRGIYRSHTGATGAYALVGFVRANDLPGARNEGGVATAFAVSWCSLDGGDPDPSWSWCSAFGGQATIVDGIPTMTLQHCLIAASDAPGLCPPGIYIDKLTFTPVLGCDAATEGPIAVDQRPTAERRVRTETWDDGEGSMFSLDLEPHGTAAFDEIRGVLETEASRLEVLGVSAVAPGGAPGAHRSLALTAFDGDAGQAIAWAGLYPDGADEMVVNRLISRGTRADARYLQTRLASYRLEKRSAGTRRNVR